MDKPPGSALGVGSLVFWAGVGVRGGRVSGRAGVERALGGAGGADSGRGDRAGSRGLGLRRRSGERGWGEAAGGVVGAREAEELRSLGIDPTFGIALNLVYSLVAFALFVWRWGRARRRAPSTAPPDSRGSGAVPT